MNLTGGAHRDKDLILKNVRDSLVKNLDQFKNMSADEIFTNRKNKFLKIGRNKGFIANTEDLSSLSASTNKIYNIINSKKIIILLRLL